MRSLVLVSALAALLTSAAVASNVIDLTPANFDEFVDSGKPALVEFFAPWCGHCKTLAPTYEKLADSYQHQKKKVVIAKVDADAHKELGQRFGVTGFPTLKWFNGKASDPEDYRGGRDLDSLSNFVKDKSGVRAKTEKSPPSNVVVLTDSTFDKIVMDAEKDVLVEFYAPWCGHCKNLAPTWESLANTFSNDKNVVVAKIDAEAENQVAAKYDIKSFPQIKLFPKGKDKKEPVPYEQGRSEQDFVGYLNEKAGTHRVAGGGLTESAGRIVDLDALAGKLSAAVSEAEKSSVYTQLEQVLSKLTSPDAKYYARVFDKFKADSQYPLKEKLRLEAIVAKGKIALDKMDNFKTRINILSAFTSPGQETKHEEL